MMRNHAYFFLGAVLAAGCGGSDGEGRDSQTATSLTTLTTSGGSDTDDPSGTTDGSGGTSDGTDSSGGSDPTTGSASDSASTTDSSSTTGGTKFDLPPQPDAPPPPENTGCTKVDLLFIIDNSGSMADEQDNLSTSFAGFINGIQTQLVDADDYHVGVITTDAYTGNAAGCTAMGNLVTKTAGVDSSNATCTPFVDGMRFMTQNDDLITKFSCAAKPGTEGNGDEKPMDAVRAALSPAQNGVGACNEGFLRSDALLVLVFITDEEDDHENIIFVTGGSQGEPIDWFNDIVAVKSGIEQNVVVLSLVGHPKPNFCPADQWDGFDGAEIATRIIQFTNMFTNGFVGDACAPDYGPIFTDAISVIDSACDNFEPPG
jgi:hypothetical protein